MPFVRFAARAGLAERYYRALPFYSLLEERWNRGTMLTTGKLLVAYALTVGVVLGQFSSADKEAMRSYALTVRRMLQYGEMSKKLLAARKQDRELDAQYKAADANQQDFQDLAAAVKAFSSTAPKVLKFMTDNGFSSREVMIIDVVILDSNRAISREEPPLFTNASNVQWVKNHRDLLLKYEILKK